MSKTVDFLHNAKVFYLATVDGTQARVRPINSAMAYNGKVYFETSNKKEMYQQMLKNPIGRIHYDLSEYNWHSIANQTLQTIQSI